MKQRGGGGEKAPVQAGPGAGPGGAFFSSALLKEGIQQLLNYLLRSVGRPCFALYRDPDNQMRTVFPRLTRGGELFAELLRLNQRHRATDRLEEQDVALLLKTLDETHEAQSLGPAFYKDQFGLVNLICPVRIARKGGSELVGVVSIGKWRQPGQSRNPFLEWLENLANRDPDYLSAFEGELVADEPRLRRLADGIPRLTASRKSSLQLRVPIAVDAFMEAFSLSLGASPLGLSEWSGLSSHFRSGSRHTAITQEQLWTRAAEILESIESHFGLPAVRLYFGSARNLGALDLVVGRWSAAESATRLTLAGTEEIELLRARPWLFLPQAEGAFAWIDPRVSFGYDRVLLMSSSAPGGALLVAAIPLSQDVVPFYGFVFLYEAMASLLFRYLEDQLFAFELDALMAETGHLMNRALGEVIDGGELVRGVLADYEGRGRQFAAAGLDSLLRGARKLKVLQKSFYFFAWRRHLQEGREASQIATELGFDLPSANIDVYYTLVSLQADFDLEARKSGRAGLRLRRGGGIAKYSPRVRGSNEMLEIVFLNLYDNALKYGYQDTWIDIFLDANESEVIVAFQNFGVGVLRDERQVVFERRVQGSLKDQYRRTEGLGMGLSLCKAVVEDMFGGTIFLHSEEMGNARFEGDKRRTTVEVRLRRVESQP